MADVSVIIPCYNRWPKIREAVDSVLMQGNALPIVVDDASTDGSAEKLREAYGDKIQLLVQDVNQEKSAARNKGIHAADSEFICFLDSDDVLLEDSVKNRLAVFAADSDFDGVVYGPVTVNGRDEKQVNDFPEGDVLKAYLEQPFLHTLSFMMRRERLLSFDLYREDLTNMEDIELFIRLMAELEFKKCEMPVADIHKQDDSASVNYDKIVSQGTRLLDYIDPELQEKMGSAYDRLSFKVHGEYARALYKSGDYKGYLQIFETVRKNWPDKAKQKQFKKRAIISGVRKWFQ